MYRNRLLFRETWCEIQVHQRQCFLWFGVIVGQELCPGILSVHCKSLNILTRKPISCFSDTVVQQREPHHNRNLQGMNLCPLSNLPSTLQILAEVALEAIRGRLTGARLALVRAAFTRLRGSGDSPPNAAAAVNVVCQFDPTGHPEVMAGRRSPKVL